MLICKLPGGVRKVGDLYKSIYSPLGVGFAELTALFCYFIFGCSSLSQLARQQVNSPSVSELSRAVANFPGNRFMRRCRQSILKKYKGDLNVDDFIFAVDDTGNPRYGKTIHACGLWATSNKSFFFGQKVLLVALIDMRRRIAIPLSYAFLLNRDNPEHEPAPTKAVKLVRECLEAGFPRLHVVTDSWFDSADLMRDFAGMGMTMVTEIKSNRVARNGAGQWVGFRKLTEIFNSPFGEVYAQPFKTDRKRGRPAARFTECKVLQIKNFKTPIKIVAVFNKRKSKSAFAYYASTDRTMPGSTVWKLSRARWYIEVLFRDLKQNLSFGSLPCSGKNASDLAVCLPLILAATLRLRPDIWGMEGGMTIGAMVSRIRNRTLDESIELLGFENSQALRERVRARRNPKTFGKKPVNQVAA